MATSINEHVRWVVGRPGSPADARSLPDLHDAFPEHPDGMFDRLGRGFSQSTAAVAAGAIACGRWHAATVNDCNSYLRIGSDQRA